MKIDINIKQNILTHFRKKYKKKLKIYILYILIIGLRTACTLITFI